MCSHRTSSIAFPQSRRLDQNPPADGIGCETVNAPHGLIYRLSLTGALFGITARDLFESPKRVPVRQIQLRHNSAKIPPASRGPFRPVSLPLPPGRSPHCQLLWRPSTLIFSSCFHRNRCLRCFCGSHASAFFFATFRDFPRLSDALQAYSNRPLCTFLWSALENLTIAQRQVAS